MADTSTSSGFATSEQIKQELQKQAFGKDAPKVDEIRKEIAKTVFEARKQLIVTQKDIFNKRDEFVQSIDKFWSTTVDRSGLDNFIDETDKEALSHLTKLHVEFATDDPREYTATFTFSDKNPYFKETELKKTFKVPAEIKKELPFDLAAPVSSEPITVSWTDDKHNLVKNSPKPDMTKMEEYDSFSGLGSFFNFFTTSEDDGMAELVLQTYENALEIYAGFAALDEEGDSDDEDEEEDDGADPTAEIDLGDSEDEKPKSKKRKA